MLALATFSRILKNHHFLLYSDSLSLLYLKGLRSMQGQLWRLFEEVAKYSFTISHVKSQDNVLADRGSRRTNLIELSDEEKELFGDVIEECEDQDKNGAGLKSEPEGSQKREKGEPRQRRPMSSEQISRCKAQQVKQLVYAERLNRGLPLDQGDHAVGEVAHFQGVWELGKVDGERNHHIHQQELGSGGEDEQLACPQECGHQQAWLPLPGGKAERVCVTRRGERNCVEKELGGFWPCARKDREVPGVIPVGEVEEEDEGGGDGDLGLG